MALQKVVNIDPAIGVPGSQAAFLGEVITPPVSSYGTAPQPLTRYPAALSA